MAIATYSFTESKREFDSKYKGQETFQSFLSNHLTFNTTAKLKKVNGSNNEQYYKWQFLYSIIASQLFPKDNIGTEIHFPKGNKNSSDIIIDAAIFDDATWFTHYKKYHNENSAESLNWLREHLLVSIEFKKEDNKNIAEVWDKQLKAYMRESTREVSFGILYDTERMYLFYTKNNKYLRLCEAYNIKGENSKTAELSLHLTDPYFVLPSFEKLVDWNKGGTIDRSKRGVNDLDIISGVQSIQINDAMSLILRTMEKVSLVNQAGFEILIQTLALKIFDEMRNEENPTKFLDFYITEEELNYKSLADKGIQTFLDRMETLRGKAKEKYYIILNANTFNRRDQNHVKVLVEIIRQFQDYSFRRSQKTDLYQLVFYKFAPEFSKGQNAQFITPLPLIEFLVGIVNPRNGETVVDPTVGIADFLSVSYVNSDSKLDDKNIYGMDIDPQMVMLATLNMLLNGDGNAKIVDKPGYGSILSKFDKQGNLIELVPSTNEGGNWDNRPDDKELKKFDVVLTNPPFGEDRAFVPTDERDREVINCYELWKLYGSSEEDNGGKKKKSKEASKIDKGVIFLENAYRILAENGRMGIVLSNSIASIDTHAVARKWLMEKMRIVAIFDLPANVFAETGVNTSIIVAYKPDEERLKTLQKQNYQVFARDIQKVGYEVKTSKRVKYFADVYKMNYDTFEYEIDENGQVIKDEEFSDTILQFREWCKTQETELQELFIKKK